MIYGGTAGRVLDALRPHKLRQDNAKEWRANSPFRPGSNSHGFKLTLDDDEHGAWVDHVSGENGSLYDLAQRLGITISERAKVEDSKRRYADIEDYALAHALTIDDLRAAGWEACTEDGRPALRFRTQYGPRFRFLDGEAPSYKSPHGFKDSWYGFLHGLDMAKGKGVLVYTNGPISVVAAQKHGIPAVTLSGGGERRIPLAMVAELKAKWDGEIWIALDCDETGRRAAFKIVEDMPTAKIIDLQLTDKGDLADLCLLHKDDAWARLQELAKTPLPPAPLALPTGAGVDGLTNALREVARARREQAPDLDVVLDKAEQQIREMRRERPRAIALSILDIVGKNEDALNEARRNPCKVRGLRSGIIDLDEAIGGFVGGRVHVMNAATGMGKSTFTAQLVAHWSHQGRGLVVPTESNPFAFVNKIAAALSGVNPEKMDTGYITDDEYQAVIEAYDMLAQRGTQFLAAGMTTPDMIRDRIQIATDEGKPFRWIAVDSLSNLSVPGTENIYDRTSAAIAELQAIALETGVMMWATSQIGRNVKDRAVKLPQLDDAKGSGDVEEDADVVLALYRHEYYVNRGLAAPSAEFPTGTALVRVLKHRHKDIGDGKSSIRVAALAGVRFASIVKEGVA